LFFKTLRAANFLSFQDLTYEFQKSGLTLIEGVNLDEGGSNASGKSNLFDAISWCLFGTTVRGLKNDAVVRWDQDDGCHVCVCLDSNGHSFEVNRYRKDKKHGNILSFTKDGKRCQLGSVAATQERLLEELQIDFDLFRCTVVFGQEEVFNFVSATDKRQKEILSKVRRIDLEHMLKTTRQKIRDVDAKRDDYGVKIKVLESHLEENPGSGFKDLSDTWEAERDENIKDAKKAVADARRKVDSIKKGFGDIDKIEGALTNTGSITSTVRGELEKVQGDIARAETTISHIDRANRKRAEFKSCPVDPKIQCPQAENMKGNIKAEEVRRGKIKKLVSGLHKRAALFRAKIETHENEQAVLSDRLAEENKKRMEHEAAGVEVKRLVGELDKIKAEKNPYTDKIEEAVRKQERIVEKLDKLRRGIRILEDSIPYWTFWENAFSDRGIKSFVFDGMCSTLTNRSNANLNILSGGSVSVSFDTQSKLKSGEVREKFECLVSYDGRKVPYEAYSGGQKNGISRSVDMALGGLMSDYYNATFNLVGFDEQTGWLDKQARERFMDLLRELSKDRHVHVIDHDAEFKSMFDDVVTVTKEGGVSVLK